MTADQTIPRPGTPNGYFIQLITEHGLCTCSAELCADELAPKPCAVCTRLDPEWDCPAYSPSSYPDTLTVLRGVLAATQTARSDRPAPDGEDDGRAWWGLVAADVVADGTGHHKVVRLPHVAPEFDPPAARKLARALDAAADWAEGGVARG